MRVSYNWIRELLPTLKADPSEVALRLSAAGLAVDGKVERQVKGGYEVRVARERAFCPLSQIDIVRTADPAVHEGKHYTFLIVEYKEGGKSIIVSRRRHLEAVAAGDGGAEKPRSAAELGGRTRGRNLRDWDLGGVRGSDASLFRSRSFRRLRP